jgi:uncharacterized membrane protein
LKLKVNNDEAEHKVKSIERQLKCEITVHLETKDEIAFLQAKVEELESQLLEKITNLDAIREEHILTINDNWNFQQKKLQIRTEKHRKSRRRKSIWKIS